METLLLPALVATLGAALTTALGGVLAFRFRARLPHVAAFGAGSLVAVALLDLLPEALEPGVLEPPAVLLAAGGGFLLLYVVEKLSLFHAHGEEHASAAHMRVGVLGAAGVTLQSLLDGMVLGVSFAADEATGLVVTLAVMLHKLTDGTSTVGLILASGNPPADARKWLALASVAPLVGVVLSLALAVPATGLVLLLAFFAGTFLYLGASHLLPEAHHADPGPTIALATLGGFGFVVAVGAVFGAA